MKKIFRTKDGKEFETESDAINHESSLEKDTTINTMQELMFKIIERASFNGFDGQKTVKFLRRNKSLWRGVTMGNDDYYTLRDIEDDIWNADTLKILCVAGKEQELKKKVKASLSPDEISIESLNDDAFGGRESKVIRAWWD